MTLSLTLTRGNTVAEFELRIAQWQSGWFLMSGSSHDGPYADGSEAVDAALSAVTLLRDAGHQVWLRLPAEFDGDAAAPP